MKTRVVQTRIWEDSWFVSLSANAQRMFLFFITNPKLELTGTFELLDRSVMAILDIKKEEFDRVIKELEGKVVYQNNYIFIVNVFKYQFYAKDESKNENQRKGFIMELLRLPESIQLLVCNYLPTGCQLVVNSLPTRLKEEIRNKKSENREEKTEIPVVIPSFVKRINQEKGIEKRNEEDLGKKIQKNVESEALKFYKHVEGERKKKKGWVDADVLMQSSDEEE